jgi:hypothetical protein
MDPGDLANKRRKFQSPQQCKVDFSYVIENKQFTKFQSPQLSPHGDQSGPRICTPAIVPEGIQKVLGTQISGGSWRKIRV